MLNSIMRFTSKWLVILLLVLLGCSTAGRDFDSTKVSHIVKGKTTASELVKMFGAHHSKMALSNDREEWIYIVPSGAKDRNRKLDIILNQGVVESYTYTIMEAGQEKPFSLGR